MKAKDYVKQFADANGGTEVLVEIGRSFLKEIEILAKARNVKTDSGLIQIVKELQQKWLKFADMVNTTYYPKERPIKPGGFLELLRMASPELYVIYSNAL